MQFLCFPPGTPIPVFPKVFDHQTHVFQVSHARVRVPKPKAFRVFLDQRGSALHQFRRRRSGRRKSGNSVRPTNRRQSIRRI